MSHVFSPPGPWHFPTFSLDPSPRQVVVNSNGPVVVPCAFNSPPGKKPEIRWKKDGLLLDLPGHGRRLLGNGSLVVDGDGDSSGGSYQCVASLAGVGTLLSTITRVDPAGECVNCENNPSSSAVRLSGIAQFDLPTKTFLALSPPHSAETFHQI